MASARVTTWKPCSITWPRRFRYGTQHWTGILIGLKYTKIAEAPSTGLPPDFFCELIEVYPSAKFILTEPDPQNWADSFGSTIYKLLAGKEQGPPEMRAWLDMVDDVIAKTGFPAGLNGDDLAKGFIAHNEAVKATIPADQLLIFEVKQGWGPLCEFLGKPEPSDPFPRTNDRAEFWDRVTGKI